MSETNRMLANHPKYVNEWNLPNSIPRSMTVEILYTDRDTLALLDYHGQTIGVGHARRHPRDKRNTELGVAIALSRLFGKMSAMYAQKVEGLTADPVPAPDDEMVKVLRQHNRAQAVHAKNERRREARERYFAENEIDPYSEKYENVDEWRGKVFGDWGHA